MLIKKAGEKNAFIAEEADWAIIEMCDKANESKIICTATPLMNSKIVLIKVKTIFTLNWVLEKLKGSVLKFKDFDKILKSLSKGISDAA
jgi:hypothetical protein